MATEAIERRGRFTVALAGGSTPEGLYRRLAAEPNAIDWSAVEFLWGDERIVTLDDERSNYRMAASSLLDPLGVLTHRRHPMLPSDIAGITDDDAASRYQETVARLFGAGPDGPPPGIDLVLLGIGSDGHTASLFPGAGALHERDRWVVPAEAPVEPIRRLTMTLPLINSARVVLFLVLGSGKADATAQILTGPFEPDRLPAQSIRPDPGELIWIVDEKVAKAEIHPSGT